MFSVDLINTVFKITGPFDVGVSFNLNSRDYELAVLPFWACLLSHYFGGNCWLSWLLLSSVGSSLWLSVWSNDSLNPDSASHYSLTDLRLGVYGALGGGEVIFTFLTSIMTNLSCLRAAKILHDGMLEHIMRAPMSFFDTTPLGRILNRFSKDIDTADVTIRFNVRMLFIQGFRALGAIIIISMETPFFLLTCLPLIVLYYFLQ
ncbi:canalicular multispecific organic anion transporter 1, partial [Trichonephila inaurata madagascariensis]